MFEVKILWIILTSLFIEKIVVIIRSTHTKKNLNHPYSENIEIKTQLYQYGPLKMIKFVFIK